MHDVHVKKPPTTAPPRTVLGMEPHHRPPSSRAARKALGQHFLIDESILQQILSASELGPQDTVVEVGPGPGALTRELVRRAKRVIAIEVDSHLAASLPESLGRPDNLRVINADARQVDLAWALEGVDDYKVVANLPYYAANPILRRFLEAGQRKPSLMVVMVQREVAESMAAQGGRMSLLAVGVQVYGIPRIVCYVPPRAFYPPPKVTSAVVRIDLRPRPAIQVEDVQEFFDLVSAGFSAPRKQLRNSLSLGLGISPDQSRRLLELAGLDPRHRPENLSLEDWGNLYRSFTQNPDRSPVEESLWKSKPTPR